MRILCLNQFFWPELAATSQLLTDVVRHLASEGHEVTVICAASSYAGADSTECPDAQIIRTPSLPFKRSLLGRALSYFSFFFFALWYGLRVPAPDAIVTMTTPPLLSLVGEMIRRLRGGRFYIWEMDLYPEIAIDLGVMKKDSFITRVWDRLVDFSRARADGIIVLSECMRARLLDRKVPYSKMHIVENWANSDRIYATARPVGQEITLLYPGSLGKAHDVETIAKAMEHFKDDSRFRFVFVGGGPGMAPLRQRCLESGVSNAEFHAYVTPDELAGMMGRAQIGLVTQIETVRGSLVPSKVYAVLAAGLPLLFIGPAPVQPARIIDRFRCGWRIAPGDSQGLIALLDMLARDTDHVGQAGRRARQAFMEHYDRGVAVQRIAQVLGIPARTPVASTRTVASVR
jgi:glycosyltransferase involved in cell wall biosynthesis